MSAFEVGEEQVAAGMTNSSSRVRSSSELMRVVLGASAGTVFEWYDYFVYGILASVLARQFFAGIDETSAFIVALLSFAAGSAVRPLGAIVFGRYGDLIGRKKTFLVTISLMAIATFSIGLLPGYAKWGSISAFLLVGLRILQGFALGGEYGGAAIYVAECSPPGRRGFFTSWIQITTPLGQIMAMSMIYILQLVIREADFAEWGWRIPFLASVLLLVVSLWIRLSMHESPVFQFMKAHGTVSKQPLKEVFLKWSNLKVLLLALFGLAAGQALVINTGMTYSFFFMTQTLKVDFSLMNGLNAIALAVTAPFFIVFGALSDKVGRKPIIMLGLVLAALLYRPIFSGLTHYANPDLERAQQTSPVSVIADPSECSFQFNPTGTARFVSSCDIVKAFLTRSGVPYTTSPAPAGTIASLAVGDKSVQSFDGSKMSKADFTKNLQATNAAFGAAVKAAGYPASADRNKVNTFMVVVLLSGLMLLATMVYGPMAALLVEMFPARIRFSSVATAYNIGNGWFGTFTSPIAFALIAATGSIYAGLWYCIGITSLSAIVGIAFLRPAQPETVEA